MAEHYNKELIDSSNESGFLSILADIIGGFSPYLGRKIRGGLAAKNEIVKALYKMKAQNAISQEDLSRTLSQLNEIHAAVKANKSGSASMQRTKGDGYLDKIKDTTKALVSKNVQAQAIASAEDAASRIGSEMTAAEAGKYIQPYVEQFEERIK